MSLLAHNIPNGNSCEAMSEMSQSPNFPLAAASVKIEALLGYPNGRNLSLGSWQQRELNWSLRLSATRSPQFPHAPKRQTRQNTARCSDSTRSSTVMELVLDHASTPQACGENQQMLLYC